MPQQRPDAEDTLEQAIIALFASLGWRTVNAYHETYGPASLLGRAAMSDVVLTRELRAALHGLNPGLPEAALDASLRSWPDRGVEELSM